MKYWYWFIGMLVAGGLGVQAQDSLQILLSPKTPHQFVFSNKVDAFWYGEVQQANSPSFMGYTIAEQRYLLDYSIWLGKQSVDRASATRISLFPDRLEREFPQLKETFWFVDSLPLLALQLESPTLQEVTVQFQWDAAVSRSVQWKDSRGLLLGHVARLAARNKPSWIAIAPTNQSFTVKWKEAHRQDNQPELEGITISVSPKTVLLVYFGMDSLETIQTFQRIRQSWPTVLDVRKRRIHQLLTTNRIQTANPMVNKAAAWARLSLDDLITHQSMPGIWAGLPWFNNYWGRDTFISFRGALLTAGKFKLAKAILQAFAARQNTRALEREYGRIPNRITLNEVVYNTADGTGWFVKAIDDYIHYSGDTRFISEIFPVVKKAIDGALEKRVDEYGLLTHGEAETWMDAAMGERAWSPRGNRAVEVQVLWLEMLRLGSQWARQLGYTQWADKWNGVYQRAVSHFKTLFWDADHQRLVDHLNSDGSPDNKVRPNAIFALTIPDSSLLEPDQQIAVIREVVDKLVYPWGVGSLEQHDPDFHPYHHYPPYYVPDAAYHNGIVWTWLSGPVLQVLLPVNSQLGEALLLENARQILQLNGVGSQSELLEAWPRPGSDYPRVSGTVSQAWNLAEWLRILQERVIGIQPRLDSGELIIAPQEVPRLFPITFDVPLGTSRLKGEINMVKEKWVVTLESESWPVDHITFQLPGEKEMVICGTAVPSKGTVTLEADLVSGRTLINGTSVTVQRTSRQLVPDMSFAQPTLDRNIPSLQRPAYALITGEEIARRPSYFSPILFEMKDATGDDRGPNGRYVYPQNPHFAPGILDIERVKIRKDKHYYYFEIKMKNLVDPGWHPEAGFQLTFLAIALNFGDKGGIRRTRVGHNANFKLPLEFAYNRIIYVGNGLEVRDGHEKILAAYFPAQEKVPLGNVGKKTIRFAIPVQYLSTHTLRNVAVLCGAQDDHGGGGIGDFRTVAREPGEWVGGGGDNSQGNPNVYDWLYIQR